MSIFGKTPYLEAKISALSDEQKSALATAINSSADNGTTYDLIGLRALEQDTIAPVKIQFNPACLRSGYLILKYNSFCTFITNELYYSGKATVIDIDLSTLKYKEIKEDCTVEEVRRILGSGSGGSDTPIVSVELSGLSGTLTDDDYEKALGDNCVLKVGTQTYYKAFSASLSIVYQAFSRQGGTGTALYDYVEITKADKSYQVLSGDIVKANPSDNATGELVKETIGNAVYSVGDSVNYLTTAPSSANTSGRLKFVVLSSEPATYYDGYYYIITESVA